MQALKLLCHCLSPIQNTETIRAEINSPEFDWNPVIYCSGQHLVTPALWFYLQQKKLLPRLNQEQQDYLKLTYDLNLNRNIKITNQLLALLPDFNAAGIEPLLLKGIASLLGELYESPGIRILGDIDILIPEDKIFIAANILQEHGYSYTPIPHHQGIVKETPKHLPGYIHKNQPAAIELHRYPVRHKHKNWVDCKAAWTTSLQISLNTGTVRLPSPEFRLIHNFCHCQIADRGYLIGFINARQLFEWVKLRDKYEEEFDWTSLQKKVEINHGSAAWESYTQAAERFFLQDAPFPTTQPILVRLFMYRQQWRTRYTSYYKVNHVVTYSIFFITETLSTLLLNFKHGPKSFINALWFSLKQLVSPKWYQKKWRILKNID